MADTIPNPPASGTLPQVTQQDLQPPQPGQGQTIPQVAASDVQAPSSDAPVSITIRPPGVHKYDTKSPLGTGEKPKNPPPAPEDDIKNDFIATRTMAQNKSPVDELNAAYGTTQQGEQTLTPQPQEQQLPNPDLSMGGRIQSYLHNTSALNMAKDAITSPWAVAKDVALGAADGPRQIAGGLLDYVNNLSQFAEDATNSLHKAGMPDIALQFTDPKTGEFSPKIMSEDEFKASGGTDMLNGLRLPTTGEPDTVTGNIIRAGTTFLAGMKPFSAAGAGPLLAGAGSGAMGGANPNAPRLSNMIDQVAPNFVTDFLKAKPEDEGTMLSHLKSGLEMAGLGTAFSGASKAIKYLKEAFPEGIPEGASEQPPPGGAGAGAKSEEPQPFLDLGNPEHPLIPEITPELRQQADDFLSGKTGTNPVRINLGRIKGTDDIKQALQNISTFIKGSPVQSNVATKQLADELGLQPEELLAGYQGQNLDAAQTTAMRFMLNSSASQLMDYADAVMYPGTNTDVAKATFLKAFSVHRALQEYAQNAATQAGRTLQSWNIMSKSTADYTKAIQGLVQSGGMEDVEKLAQGISNAKSAVQAGKIVADASKNAPKDVFMKYLYDDYLSNPQTVIKKLGSDTLQGIWNMAVRFYAGNYMPAASGEINPKEWAQMAYGYASSFRDGLRLAGQALKTGQAQFSGENYLDSLSSLKQRAVADTMPDQLTEGAPGKSISSFLSSVISKSQAFGNEFMRQAGQVGDALKQPGIGGKVSALADAAPAAHPRTWIVAANEIGEYMHYRGELRALAFRDAMQGGADSSDVNFSANIRDVMDNAPQDMRETAYANAKNAVFLDPLKGAAQTLAKLSSQLNIPIAGTKFELPFGNIIMPFKSVPLNIAKWSYRNSGLAAAFPSDAVKAELAAGGATRDLAIARMQLGSALALSSMDLALNNSITGRGPNDPQMKRAWKAAISPDGQDPSYSLKINGKMYGYSKFEPMGLMMGAMADTVGLMRFANDQDRENIAASMMFGFGNSVMSKTYLSGASNFLNALENPDNDGKKWVDNLTASFIPGSAGLNALGEATDKWQRAHYDLLDTIESKLPFLRNNLPPQRTWLGDPVPIRDAFAPMLSGTGIARSISPVSLAPAEGAEPIDKWIWDNRMAFSQSANGKLGISRPEQIVSFPAGPHVSAQVQLDPQTYDKYQEQAGNGLKMFNGLGMKDALNSLVKGKYPDEDMQQQWDKAAPAGKALMVQTFVSKARTAARMSFLDPTSENYNLDVSNAVKAGWQARASALQGGQQ